MMKNMSKVFMFLVLSGISIGLLADARVVEAPAECHFPYDNNNVDNEFKLLSCVGVLKTRLGTADVAAYVEHENLPGSTYVIDGQDVRDVDAYPSGVLTVTTSGIESGTNCNIVAANGTTYTTPNWDVKTRVFRTQDRYRVNVSYELSCWGGVAQ